MEGGMRHQRHHAQQVFLRQVVLFLDGIAQGFVFAAQRSQQGGPSGFIGTQQRPAFLPVGLVILAAQRAVGVGQRPAQMFDVGGDGGARLAAAVDRTRGFGCADVLSVPRMPLSGSLSMNQVLRGSGGPS